MGNCLPRRPDLLFSAGRSSKIENDPAKMATVPAVENQSQLCLVGARGFEPPTSRSQTERTTRLCYAP